MRTDWKLQEVEALFRQPLFELLAQASAVHREFHDPSVVQVCTLISVKTGGCQEDCKYCAQSSRYKTTVKAEAMLNVEDVKKRAKKAMETGATRICMGAAWRGVRDGAAFDSILKMVEEVAAMGVEVCCSLGMINGPQASRLKEAGLYAYNHNLDTSREFYPEIITTRTYDERLATLDIARKANITVCCGGIVGLGESDEDRISFLHTLCTLPRHPDSVPINILHRVPGTPLADQKPIEFWQVLRTIAAARILMPKSIVRMSAGRDALSFEQQALCFQAGANSVHFGEKLLTVPNSPIDRDEMMFALFGLKKRTLNAKKTD